MTRFDINTVKNDNGCLIPVKRFAPSKGGKTVVDRIVRGTRRADCIHSVITPGNPDTSEGKRLVLPAYKTNNPAKCPSQKPSNSSGPPLS
jgi:hypothetical protein